MILLLLNFKSKHLSEKGTLRCTNGINLHAAAANNKYIKHEADRFCFFTSPFLNSISLLRRFKVRWRPSSRELHFCCMARALASRWSSNELLLAYNEKKGKLASSHHSIFFFFKSKLGVTEPTCWSSMLKRSPVLECFLWQDKSVTMNLSL